MATRTIQASISSGANTDLEPGMSVQFGVTSDTGPVSGMTATGGSLYLSRVKIFSSAFYLTVSPSSGGTAKTETLTANSGDTASTTLDLDSVNDGLLSGSPSSITLTVTKVSGDKTKMNFREGCTLTLKIDYLEGSSGGGDDGGDSGGGSSGGSSVPQVTGVSISSNQSGGEAVTLSWDAVESPIPALLSISHYQILRLLTNTKDLDSSSDVIDYAVPWVANTGNVTTYQVYPPDRIGHYYGYAVRAVPPGGESYAGDWSDLVWLERVQATADLDPYTDAVLKANETPVKAVHMTELQSNINKIRTTLGLGAYQFTTITSGTTGLAGWTDHVREMRTALDEVSSDHEAWISIEVNQPRADVMMQLREVTAAIAAG